MLVISCPSPIIILITYIQLMQLVKLLQLSSFSLQPIYRLVGIYTRKKEMGMKLPFLYAFLLAISKVHNRHRNFLKEVRKTRCHPRYNQPVSLDLYQVGECKVKVDEGRII